jgi:hypothetical protein
MTLEEGWKVKPSDLGRRNRNQEANNAVRLRTLIDQPVLNVKQSCPWSTAVYTT